MFFTVIKRCQKGMSMAEGAMTMGLIGLGALAAASLSGNMSSQAQKSEGIVARSQFASALGTYLYTSMGCEDLKTARPTYSDTPGPIAITRWKYLGIDRFEGGVDSEGKKLTATKYFDIEKLEAYIETLSGAPKVKSVMSGGAVLDLNKTILKIRAVLKVGNQPAEFVYNIPVLVGNDGSIGYCSDEKTVAETCASMRGVYDPAAKKCNMEDGCLLRGTFAVLSCNPYAANQCDDERFSDPSLFVNPYTHTANCPADSVQKLTNTLTWNSQVKVGKKGNADVPNLMNWYACLKCPGTPAP